MRLHGAICTHWFTTASSLYVKDTRSDLTDPRFSNAKTVFHDFGLFFSFRVLFYTVHKYDPHTSYREIWRDFLHTRHTINNVEQMQMLLPFYNVI